LHPFRPFAHASATPGVPRITIKSRTREVCTSCERPTNPRRFVYTLCPGRRAQSRASHRAITVGQKAAPYPYSVLHSIREIRTPDATADLAKSSDAATDTRESWLKGAPMASRKRSDLPLKEWKLLALASGNECAFPGCSRALSIPAETDKPGVVTGIAAHVVAASRQGGWHQS
jgi:hypothetical protein